MSKSNKYLCGIGSLLLLVMALFHLSGLEWITAEIDSSDAKPFLKEVFPVLFTHVSLQLLGLAALGASLIVVAGNTRLIAAFIAVMSAANVALALWLGAYPPGILLAIAATCFGVVAGRQSTGKSS